MTNAAPSSKPADRVLVVEDDHHVCELLSDILIYDGFEPHCVSTDREAYDRLRHGGFAALLLDVNLGSGTTGYDVARFARQIDPDLPVVYVSGESSQTSFAAFGVPGSLFVAKPFTGPELMARLRTLMAANDDGR